MLLSNQGKYNDLSPELRKELMEKVRGFGKKVRYKFDISHPNPDPLKEGGAIVWPTIYTLQPATFNINDKKEKRDGKSNSKAIGLIDRTDDKGIPTKFRKIKIHGKDAGILKLDIEENPDDFDYAMYLELHPKLMGGMFSDKNKRQVVTRIDEHKLAKEARELRSDKIKALNAVQGMSDEELVDFADAMLWDSAEDPELLRNRAEELAETNPVYLNDKIKGRTVEYQATIKQAMDRGLISFDPVEYKFYYTDNRQTIAMLTPTGTKNEVEKMAEFLQTGGAKADEIFKKIKALNKK